MGLCRTSSCGSVGWGGDGGGEWGGRGEAYPRNMDSGKDPTSGMCDALVQAGAL